MTCCPFPRTWEVACVGPFPYNVPWMVPFTIQLQWQGFHNRTSSHTTCITYYFVHQWENMCAQRLFSYMQNSWTVSLCLWRSQRPDHTDNINSMEEQSCLFNTACFHIKAYPVLSMIKVDLSDWFEWAPDFISIYKQNLFMWKTHSICTFIGICR